MLLTQLEHVKDAAMDHQEYALGFTCLAVPVRSPGLTASLAVSLPVDRAPFNIAGLTEVLRNAADRLSLRLGADRVGRSGP